MPDDAPTPAPRPPAPAGAPLDRAAVERVLARAAELQVQATAGDATDAISEAQLLEIGREVGIAPTALRQALAEERTRVTLAPESGLAARVAGPALVSASRVIPLAPAVVLATLERWLREDYDLREKRRYEGRRTWEHRANGRARLSKALKGNAAAHAVANASEVGVTVTALGDGRSAVRFDCDVRGARQGRIAGGLALAGGGVTTSAIVLGVGTIVASAPFMVLVAAAAALPLLGMGL
ncbi:MAG: hypothetical protein MUF21_05270, partial [Gemmatimonadaceae bacterium]|nr:hypothetical protein [Gemmatimonadaceae bacterium]